MRSLLFDEFFSLLGDKMSLDGVEHEMLRKRYGEPRVHYAVNCASVGCPMLREEAYVAVRLEVSKIFDWFKEDFEPRERYFARYAEVLSDNPRDREKIAAGALPISFLNYDWSLNDLRSSSPR